MSQFYIYDNAPGTADIVTVTGNSGGAVGPDGAGNLNVVGAGNINVTGTVGTFTETITLVGTTDFSVQIGNSSGSLTSLAAATNGQLIIGSTGLAPVVASLTSSDASVLITNGAGSIDLKVASGGTTWSDESGIFSPLEGNGYFITATATGTLPVAPADGDTIAFNVIIANVLTIQAAVPQLIRVGDAISGAGGTAASTAIGDSIVLVYRLSSTTWHALSSIGIWDIV